MEFILKTIGSDNSIKVVSVLSHLAASEDLSEAEFSKMQIASYTKTCDELFSGLGYAPMQHMLNTSGILNYPEAQFDMVRRRDRIIRIWQ